MGWSLGELCYQGELARRVSSPLRGEMGRSLGEPWEPLGNPDTIAKRDARRDGREPWGTLGALGSPDTIAKRDARRDGREPWETLRS